MSNEDKIDQLENTGMLDMMLHQYHRYKQSNNLISYFGSWKKWIRQ